MCNRELVCGVLCWLSDKVKISLTTSCLWYLATEGNSTYYSLGGHYNFLFIRKKSARVAFNFKPIRDRTKVTCFLLSLHRYNEKAALVNLNKTTPLIITVFLISGHAQLHIS